jgi:DNA-binding CsgD family transcriptional regulator
MVGMENHFRNLRAKDIQRVMDLCRRLYCAEPDRSFVSHCQAILQEGFSNVHFSAERYQLKPFALLEQPIDSVDEKYLPLFYEHMLDHPYLARMLIDASTETGMTHIEPMAENFRKSSLYNEFYTEVQAQNQIWVGIRSGNELLACVYSREAEYTDEDLAMMCIIQPHLEAAWQSWRRTGSLKKELSQLRQALFRSEEEEAAIAAGLDNQQIADQLKISVLTVKKHLQTIFHTLDVHHRTELAAKWHQAHSITLY